MKTCPVCDTPYPDQHATCPTDGAVLIETRELEPGHMALLDTQRVERIQSVGSQAVRLAGLQQREHNILSAQELAKKDREEAQRLRDELQKKMDAAAAEVREMFEKARREAQGAADEMTAKAKADIQTERDRLRRELDTAGDQVLQSILNRVGQMVTLVSSKVIRRELTGDDHRRLVDEALKDLGEANVDWKDRIRF